MDDLTKTKEKMIKDRITDSRYQLKTKSGVRFSAMPNDPTAPDSMMTSRRRMILGHKSIEVTDQEMITFMEQQNKLDKPVFSEPDPVQMQTMSHSEKKAHKKECKRQNREKKAAYQDAKKREKERGAAFFQLVQLRRKKEKDLPDDIMKQTMEKLRKTHPSMSDLDLKIMSMEHLADYDQPDSQEYTDKTIYWMKQETALFCKLNKVTDSMHTKLKVRDNSTPEDISGIDAIRAYTGDNYVPMNAYLRSPQEYEAKPPNGLFFGTGTQDERMRRKEMYKDFCALGKHVLQDCPMTHSAIVMRGVRSDAINSMLNLNCSDQNKSLDEQVAEKLEELTDAKTCVEQNRIMVDNGFVSTAHAVKNSGFRLSFRLVIQVNKGTNALNICESELEEHGDEHELLLAPGTPMRMLKAEQQGDTWLLYAETIANQQTCVKGGAV